MAKLDNWYQQATVGDVDKPEIQTEPQSKLEQFMLDSASTQSSALESSMRIGQGSDPERQARVIKQQMRTGLAPDLIERNLEDIELASSDSDFDAENFRKNSPIVADWLSDPENAKLAFDDVGTLTGLEWLFQAPAKAFKEGSDQTQLAQLRFKQLGEGLSDEELKLVEDLKSRKRVDYGVESWLEGALVETAKQLPNMLESVKGGLELAIPASLAAGGTALAAGQMGPQVALPEEFVTVPAATTTGAAIGFRTGALKTSFELETGFAYDEFLDFKDINGQPLDDDVAKTASLVAGGINAGVELLQLDVLIKSFPGIKKYLSKGGTQLVKDALKNPTTVDALKKFSQKYGTVVSIETLTEIGQELVTMVAGEAAKMYQGEFEDADFAQMGDRILETADAALKASALLAAPGPTAGFVYDYAKTKKANQNKAVMQSLGEITENSKVNQRVPEKLREVVKSIKEQGTVQDVMIPVEQWDTLFQSQGLEPGAVAAEVMGDEGAHYAEARATGADMVIPLEVYTEKLAGSQYHAQLLDDVRFHPEEMTSREARQWEEANAGIIEEAMQNVASNIVQDDGTQFIFDDVVGQLVGTGMERGTAESNAMQMQAAFRTLSSRTGIPVNDLWERYGPTIKREMPEALKKKDFDVSLDPFIDRVRSGDIPGESDVYGPTLLDALRERGIIDEGGELAARDIDVGLKPFQRKIIREEGLTVDDAAQQMAAAGYLDAGVDTVTQNDLFEAIDRELSGDPVYSIQNQNAQLAEERASLLELSDYLGTLQVDLEQLTNSQVRALLLEQVTGEQIADEALYQAESINELKDRLISENEGLKLSIRGKGDIVTLDKIIIPEEQRGDGIGTKVLSEITGWADSNGKTIALTPSSDFGGTVSRLKKLYKSLGFVENKGKNKDFEISESMYRSPEDVVTLFQDVPTGEEFTNWAGTEEIIESEDINDTDFSEEGPFVVRAYHGTTHDFSEFNASLKGAVEGQFGAVNYFSSSLYDVETNYLAEGTDLTNRIEQRAEQIENDPEEFGIDENLNPEEIETLARQMAEDELKGTEEKVLEVFVRTENPFVVGDGSPWLEVFDEQEIEDKAIELVAENNDIDESEVKENREDYEDEIDDARWEAKEEIENPIFEAVQTVADRYDLDPSELMAELYEVTTEGEVGHSSLEDAIRNSEFAMYAEDPDTGSIIGSQIVADVIQELGFDSIILKDAEQRFENMDMEPGTTHIHVFDENNTNIKSAENVGTFDPTDPNIYQQEKRGQIRISPEKDFEITFFDKADLSTMLHESGHLYLEVIQDLESRGELSESMAEDLATIREWVGAKPGESMSRDQHEQFARGFEAYLREGKAPTTELQAAFAKFRAWLVSIYRQISRLNVQVTDEVKEVFDRLLATDEEIKAAEQMQEYTRLFESAEEAQMTEAEFSKYQETAMQARDDAQAAVAKKQMTTMEREQKKWWKQAREEMQAEVMEEIAMNPTYQALSYLQRGELVDGPLPEDVQHTKIDKQSLVDAYGKDFLKRLPKPYIYSVEGGIHQDDIAAMFGFNSGDEMIQAIMVAPKQKDFVKAEVDRRMRDKYGDIQTDGTLPQEAMEAVHNNKRGEVLTMELRALARKSRNPAKPSPASIMKQAAEASVSRKLVRNINAGVYLRAERKAAKEAIELTAQGDFDGALAAKQRQLLNFYLGNAARKAKEDTEKAREYLNGFNKNKKREQLGKAGQDYLDQIDSLLEKAEFRRVSLKSLDRRASLDSWIKDQEEQGFSVDVPQELINQTQVVNWKDMTVESLLGLRDSVKNIDHLARFKNKLLASAEKRAFNEVVDDVVSSIEANNKITPVLPNFAPGFKDKLKEGLSGYAAWHTKMEFLFEMLDGNKAGGSAWTALFKPLADAEIAEQQMNEKFTAKLRDILNVYTSKERGQWSVQKVHIPGVGTINKETALSVALNWGNAGNRQALLDSSAYKWSELQVQQILELLDERDWNTVQNIWDMVNELWPDIAQLQKDLTGLAPNKVESMPVQTQFGEFRGGYYPLVYDTKLSQKAFIRDEKNASKDLFENNFAKPATRKGHTIERVGSAGQSVKLSLDVIGQHMNQAIHDLTHRRSIIDVDRLINNTKVREAIEGAAGQEMYRQIRPWLQSIANERQELFSNYEKVLAHIRTGATIVNMGVKFTTAFAQPLGFLQTVDEIGSQYALRGLTDFFGKPTEMQAKLEFVMSRSTMMRNRQKTFDRDVRDSLNRLNKENKLDRMQESYFYMTGLFDMAVSVPSWLGAYRKAMDGNVENIEKGNEQKAIDYADRSVRVSQSAGGTKDLARIQRGSQTFRLFTMFYSYFSVLYNLMQTRYKQFKTGQATIPQTAASFIFLVAAPAVLGELAASRGPGEDEDYATWAGKHMAMYPFQTIVGVRDVVNALGPFGYSASPAFDAFEKTAKAAQIPFKAGMGEEIKRSDVKAAVLSASYWGKLPGRQMWITGEYIYDVSTGDEDPESVWEFTHNLMFARPANER